MTTASVGRLALSALLASTLGACALSGPGAVKATPSTSAFAIVSPTPPNITPPTNLVRPGTITFLSDTTYPPQESTDPATQQAVGFDIDIAQAIAAKMGLSATIQKTDSPQIVGALLAKKGDAIISALQITPDLERQVALVAYFRAGQAILVRKGNPSGIGGLTDLCGKNVSVQVQSPEEGTIDEANGGVCKGNAIKKHVYPTDLQAVLILKQRGVDAALDDSPVAAYFVKQTPDQLELAGGPFKTNPEGIAIDPKNGELLKAIQQAMMAIYQDGSYRQILTKWNLLVAGRSPRPGEFLSAVPGAGVPHLGGIGQVHQDGTGLEDPGETKPPEKSTTIPEQKRPMLDPGTGAKTPDVPVDDPDALVVSASGGAILRYCSQAFAAPC